ncbi:MAG: universal stress protein [Bacteroidia bacterium]|nr:universal stress protein [Bacteroidia bacterium]
MKKILVPIDFSADSVNALEHAISFANIIEADVRMIHVKRSKNFEMPFYFKDFDMVVGKSLDDFMNILIEKYKGKIKTKLDYKIREGNVFKEITNQAKYDDAYLIIMGTHGASGFEELMIGSNAFRVVSNAPCPIITIRNGFEHKDLKNVVMPIDFSKETRQKVPFVTELARFFGATVHVIGVAEISSVDITSKINTYCTQVEEYLKEKGVNCTKEVLVGSNITDITIDYAKKVNAELITIMTDQLTNAAFWLGPYAQQMVNHSPIPVLSIRSQG